RLHHAVLASLINAHLSSACALEYESAHLAANASQKYRGLPSALNVVPEPEQCWFHPKYFLAIHHQYAGVCASQWHQARYGCQMPGLALRLRKSILIILRPWPLRPLPRGLIRLNQNHRFSDIRSVTD